MYHGSLRNHREEGPHTLDLHVRNFPQDLRRELRARAVVQDRTLREIIIEAAKKWLVENDSKRKTRKKVARS